MLRYEITLTNEECLAIAPFLNRIEDQLTWKLMKERQDERDQSALAYAVFRKITHAIRPHIQKVRELNAKEREARRTSRRGW